MADYQEMREQILGLMESLEEVQASSDPEAGYAHLAGRIDDLEARFDDLRDNIISRLDSMESTIMDRLCGLGPFYYPITTTWPGTNPQQPWQPQYEPPYKIICEGGLTSGMTTGSNSAEGPQFVNPRAHLYATPEQLQAMAEPLRGFQHTEGYMPPRIKRRRTCR